MENSQNLDQIKGIISNLILTKVILETEDEFYQEIQDRINKYLKIYYFTLELGKTLGAEFKFRKIRYKLFFFLFQDKKRILSESVWVFEEEFMLKV